ncbi:hypothetical protein [Pedobacter sp. MR22-3]|uniref:hypothetical protein n=1 Tax=Pedobacter sp. MR22-3 TaxID=2994552 RepID=UPI002245832B|nr:hypothetical protein [Pedobacter sp. MR22-3]MCX2584398.1 hypothetical protein [Pedobacter sp. MR22-3]
MKKIIILSIVLVTLSLFSGISINSNWFFIYQFEFIDYPKIIVADNAKIVKILLWAVVVLAHLGIISLPFITKTTYYNKILFWAPLIYLLGYVFLRAEFIVLLIPFIIIWLIIMRVTQRSAISLKHSV